MKANKILLPAIVIVLLVGLLTINDYVIARVAMESAPQRIDTRVLTVVKAICDHSRVIMDGEAENACGIAQDTTNTEYLCRSYSTTVDCWVEDKQGE